MFTLMLALVMYGVGLQKVREYQNAERFNLAMYRSVGRKVRSPEVAEMYRRHYLGEWYWAQAFRKLASIPATVGAIGVTFLTLRQLTYWFS